MLSLLNSCSNDSHRHECFTSQIVLAAINIPPVSGKVITNRMKEAGLSVEEIAKESMQEAISEERLLTHE